MDTTISNYYKRIISLITELFHSEFIKTTPGHCMKVTGLREKELEFLWSHINDKYNHIDIFIVSNNGHIGNTKYITATKLIEYRNKEQKPLLILIPASNRTAAEDSYGNATFKEISLIEVEKELFNQLESNIPQEYSKIISSILKHPYDHAFTLSDKINFLLFLEEQQYSKENIGNALSFLHLIPDSKLLDDKSRVRARLNLNMQSAQRLTDFSKPLFDRIKALQLADQSIHQELVEFYRKNPEVKERNKIMKLLRTHETQLNLSNWPINQVNPNEFELFVDEIVSRDFAIDQGEKVLNVAQGKSVKVTLKIRTVPKPIELEQVKFFRILLVQVDGASGTEVLELRRMKKTATQQHFRKAQVVINTDIVEEGCYFFRVIAEDEAGNKLNIRDGFKESRIQSDWEDDLEAVNKQEIPQEQKDSQIVQLLDTYEQFKKTCDSEDFDLVIDGDEEVEPALRKDKLKNTLQAYFAFRIDQLKKQEELTLPEIKDESGTWLNDTANKLTATYYLKYSNSHNYQINIANKLRKLQWMFLENKNQFGYVEATTRNEAAAIDFEQLNFISSEDQDVKIPEELINCRRSLFEAILQSDKNGKGILETFGFHNHTDLIKDYLKEYNNWIELIKNQKADANSFQILETIQNFDLIKMTMRLPNQTPIQICLLSPLHPLRLAWHMQLFDLFTFWENQTLQFEGHIKEWKQLETFFQGTLYPENNPLVWIDSNDNKTYQYAGELLYNWGIYIKTGAIEKQNGFSSINRQVITYLRNILNIGAESFIDTDINKTLIVRHLKNYASQHPYIDKLVVNLFNAGDAMVFADALIELEKSKELNHITYEVRLFKGDDNIINHGQGLKQLINPEFNISEEAEAFSQQSQNRLFPKLRFSVSSLENFIQNPSDYEAHISFLVNLFPVETQLVKNNGNGKNFYLNGVITHPEIQVKESNSEIKWNRFIHPNQLANPVNQDANGAINLFKNIQAISANLLAGRETDSLPSTQLHLTEKDNVHIALVHDHSDWVITFDRNLGPEAFDQPSQNGYIPFLLDYIPGEEISGISSFLTTRPNSEILGLLTPHFSEFGIDLLNKDENIATSILLEDVRAISSSLVMQLNSGKNKAFEVIGSAFTKRVLEKKNFLSEAFLIPVDLHQNLFNNVEFESKSRADNLLVKFDLANRTIDIIVLEIKCRSHLNQIEKEELKHKIKDQITNTINALRLHFDPEYSLSFDRLDREIKNKELQAFLKFYINRASRYNYLDQQIADNYTQFLNTLDQSFSIQFKELGFIFDFSFSEKHAKESFDEDLTIYTFGEKLIADILDPKSDLNTQRLEDSELTAQLTNTIGKANWYPKKSEQKTNQQPVDYPENKEVKTLSEPVQPNDSEYKKEQENSQTKQELENTKREVQIVTESSVVTENQPDVQDESAANAPHYDLLIGKSSESNQYGVIGQTIHNKKLALDLSETNTISLFGVQGGGKSYSIGTVTEMVLKQFKQVNLLPSPLAGVIFHYSESMDYAPEFTSMIHANDQDVELQKLKENYGVEPDNIEDVIMLTPKDKIEERMSEYPSIDILPIAFNSKELNVQDWLFLLGAIGNDSTYVKQLKAIMKQNRRGLSLQKITESVEESILLTNTQKALAKQKLSFAAEYIDDDFTLKEVLKPGRLIVVDLRDEFIDKDEALGLFVIMLNIFSGVKTINQNPFNKFIVFDEAHKYMDNKDLTGNIVTAIREMRHKGVSIMIASQDPPSLPNEIIELSSVVLLHKFNSPQWLKHVQKSITQLAPLHSADLAALMPGEAFLWATKATDKSITTKPVKIQTRPRVTKHGGATVKATLDT